MFLGEEVANNCEALRFVPVKIGKQMIIPSLVDDISLPRVFFLSLRRRLSETAAMASQVTNCHFVSLHGSAFTSTTGSVAVEMGVGFLPPNNITCLAFVVCGNFVDVAEFVDEVADIVIVELEPTAAAAGCVSCSLTSVSSFPSCKVLHWEINPSDQGKEKQARKIWGPATIVSQQICNFLSQSCLLAAQPNCDRKSVKDMFCPHRFISTSGLQEVVQKVHFETLRDRDNLFLQKRCVKEEPIDSCFRRLEDRMEPESLENQAWNHPILQYFVSLLSKTEDPEFRRFAIANLEATIAEKCHDVLEEIGARVYQSFLEFQRLPESIDARSNYYRDRREYVSKTVGLEHLWRELRCIFISDPSKSQVLARLAATHLLDGFPLEILDGDAGKYCETWVSTIMRELDEAASLGLGHKPRVFVLSVMGPQSSGKSTLLNIMFGTQLRTSVGQCTRGVYLQLIRSELPEFDYVLILDTEGIQSPELHGLADANVHDNLMATFAILPADACIIMVTNEDDSGLKEVLPLVMLAYKRSAMAEKSSGCLRAKIFFVYRSVDINDTKKLKDNQRKLQEYLREVAEKLINQEQGAVKSKARDFLDSVFSDFQASIEEEESDVKFLGNCRKGNLPPGDTPDWNYGEQVMRLREYIHGRVTKDPNWSAQPLRDWVEYMNLVWQCISEANFESNFKSEVEYRTYLDLQDRLQHPCGEVSRKYVREFEELDGELMQVEDRKDELSPHMLHVLLHSKVMETVEKQSRRVQEILQEKHCEPWQVEESRKWEEFLLARSNLYKHKLQVCLDDVLKFGTTFQFYDQKMQEEILKMANSPHMICISDCNDEQWKQCFEDTFEGILQDASKHYKPLAYLVPQRIDNLYCKHIITAEFDLSVPRLKRLDKATLGEQFLEMIGRKKETRIVALESVKIKIENCLRDVKQYSHYSVESIIGITGSHVLHLAKKDQGEVHYTVKQIMTEKLQAIQRRWDKDHNIVEKLRVQEPRFHELFYNCVNKVKGKEMLLGELRRLMIDRLDLAFKERLAKEVSGMLQSEEWVFNWKILRACLDLHLVALIERKQTDLLLELVKDGNWHYRMVTEILIVKRLKSVADNCWKQFIEDVKDATSRAAAPPSIHDNYNMESTSLFLSRLKEQLINCSKELFLIISQINSNIYEGMEIRYNEVVVELCCMMDAVQMPQLQKKEDLQPVIHSILNALINSFENMNLQPRCRVSCPHCNLTCFHPHGHNSSIRHDTLHQPQGLAGWRNKDEKVLLEFSCSQSVESGQSFLLCMEDGTVERYPYGEFEKVYTEWKLPSIKDCRSMKVREYIFYNYQGALVDKYPGTKKCIKNMPADYNHDLQLIRLELTNLLPESLHQW